MKNNKNEWEFIPRSRVGDLRIGISFRIGGLVTLRELAVLGELVVFIENWSIGNFEKIGSIGRIDSIHRELATIT